MIVRLNGLTRNKQVALYIFTPQQHSALQLSATPHMIGMHDCKVAIIHHGQVLSKQGVEILNIEEVPMLYHSHSATSLWIKPILRSCFLFFSFGNSIQFPPSALIPASQVILINEDSYRTQLLLHWQLIYNMLAQIINKCQI